VKAPAVVKTDPAPASVNVVLVAPPVIAMAPLQVKVTASLMVAAPVPAMVNLPIVKLASTVSVAPAETTISSPDTGNVGAHVPVVRVPAPVSVAVAAYMVFALIPNRINVNTKNNLENLFFIILNFTC